MSKKILVVDDEPNIVKMVANRLKVSGYEVITATDGLDCFEKAQEAKPDLILLDILMPKMDGFLTLKKLKDSIITKDTPVIMFTAKGQGDDVEKAAELGAIDYIVKPFTPIILFDKIKKALKSTTK